MTLRHRLREGRLVVRCPREVDTLSSGACLRDKTRGVSASVRGRGQGWRDRPAPRPQSILLAVAEYDAGNACRSAHGRLVHGPQIMGARTSVSTPLHCTDGPVDKCRDKIVTRLSTDAPVMTSQTLWCYRLVDRGSRPCERTAFGTLAKPMRYQYTRRGAPASGLCGQQRQQLCVSLLLVRSGECTIIGVRSCFSEQHWVRGSMPPGPQSRPSRPWGQFGVDARPEDEAQ